MQQFDARNSYQSPLSDNNLNPYNTNKSSFNSYLLEFVQTITICLVIGIIIYWQIAQPHKVSGSSMSPTFKTGDYIITNKLIYKFSPPKRGDIVVLKNPQNLSEDFIKRIMGLPGEKIKIQNGKVYINGEVLTETYLPPTLKTNSDSFLSEGREVIIPPNEYCVMGDNREQSSDSRKWKFVPKLDITGKVFIRYWPQDAIGFIPAEVKY